MKNSIIDKEINPPNKKEEKGLINKSDFENLTLKNKYQIQFFAKGGGFGEVYIAKHINKDYEVAVKFVSHFYL